MARGDNWGAVQALFDELIDLDPARREAHLGSRHIDPAIAGEVRSLLLASDTEGLLDHERAFPGNPDSGSALSYSSLTSGTAVGQFTVDRLIGRGGMGEVYAAHRSDGSFDQRVALKLLRPEAAARADLFDRERRMLAGLEHPGIARLIDGGIATDGRPYMAMEYVDGAPIDAWCAAHGADLDIRLRLAREICDAVGYAHARLVIHRDLKPSNILVDESGRARLLDFGVSGLLDESMTTGVPTQALVTPDYAAPEQLGNEPSTVATDIYALGAVLYQLLAGRGPWAGSGNSLPSLIRRVLNDDPALPSSVIGGPVAASRLSGDLDAIVMKAMRRNPAERYRSAAELGDDIARHQRLEPVTAREGSTRYMIGRFVRRYRWAVGASVAAVVALMIGAGGVAWQARQTAIERDAARAETARVEGINQAMLLVFRDASDPTQLQSITVRDMIQSATRRMLGSMPAESPDAAPAIGALADLYLVMENTTDAKALLTGAMARRIALHDPENTAGFQLRLAAILAGEGQFAEAQRLLRAANAVWQSDPVRFGRQRADTFSVQALILRRQNRRDDAIRLLLGDMDNAEKAFANDERNLSARYASLATLLIEAGRLGEAEELLERKGFTLTHAGGPPSTASLNLRRLLSEVHTREGKLIEADTVLASTIADRRRYYGPSIALAVDLLRYARLLNQQGKYLAALQVLGSAAPMADEYFGVQSHPSRQIRIAQVEAFAMSGRVAEARKLLTSFARPTNDGDLQSLTMARFLRSEAALAFAEGRPGVALDKLRRADATAAKVAANVEYFRAETNDLRRRIDGQAVAVRTKQQI